MRTGTRSAVVAAAVALVIAGCNEDTCPTETPQVEALANCSAGANQLVQYPVRLCPECDQVISSCDADVSGSTIFLNPIVETCESSTCGGAPACQQNTCNFTTPGLPGTYSVQAFDPISGLPREGTLTVLASGAPSCAFPPL